MKNLLRLLVWASVLVEVVFACPNRHESQSPLLLGTTSQEALEVALDSGVIEGIMLVNNIRAFKGIPYAAPPTGALRWHPPHPVTSWNGTRSTSVYGPSCMQLLPPKNSLYFGGETDMSEDCLYLNVWTGGASQQKHGGRPVLVILHFGAYQFGSASNPIYDGTAMASRGLTVVSINYRLGRMGFLTHPDLTSESGTNSSGNYGLMDQLAALQWVQRNIAAFDGDPDNVTLMGVSAGANSIHNLRSSPLAKGLFNKCIVASGPGFAHAWDGPGHPANPSTLAAGEAAGVEVATLLGVGSITELRTISAEDVMAIQLPRAKGSWSFDLLPKGAKTSLHVFDSGYPVIDGRVLTRAPLEAMLSEDRDTFIDVPMLASNTGNEASGLAYTASLHVYRTYLESTFGTLAEEALMLYPACKDTEAQRASWQLLADQVFNWSMWTAARLQARRLRSKIWFSKFLRRPSIPTDSDLIEREYAGAYHGADIMYALGNLDAYPWNWTDQDRQLSKQIMDSWVNFAQTGDPNGFGDVNWPAMDSDVDGPVKIWDVLPRLDATSPEKERMMFWDRFHGVANIL